MGSRVLAVVGLAAVLVACGDNKEGDPDGSNPDDTTPSQTTDPRAPLRNCVATSAFTWTPQASDDYEEIATYDEHGSLIQLIHDEPGDNQYYTDDYTEDWKRRPDGQFTEYTLDLGSDGTVDARQTYTYRDGGLASWEHDFDGDGQVDERSEFDSDGEDVLEERYDWDADGDVDTVFEFEYDNGLLVRITRDDGPDNTINWIARYNYTPTDLVRSYETDEGVDGLVERSDTWEYDERGRETLYNSFNALDAINIVNVSTSYLDDDDLPDFGFREAYAYPTLVEYVDWTVRYDALGRAEQREWFNDLTGDRISDRQLTQTVTFDCRP